MGEFLIALGKDIRDCRKANRITLEKLELVTGITRKTLIRLEKGEEVKFSTVEKVLRALGITLSTSIPKPMSENGGEDEWF
jgi:transcriptional regulator with XRE-family HTH domain